MRRRLAAGTILAAMAATALSVAAAPAATAHPLGNFTHNTYVGFTVSPGHVAVEHVLDLAEVPTYQERRAMDTDADGGVSDTEAATWGSERCSTAAALVTATTGVGPVVWRVGASSVTFPAGQGGLPTTRLECAFGADVAAATSFDATVAIEQGRVGWHEVTAVGDGVDVTSDAPSTSPSQRLTAYPMDSAPVDVTSVRVDWSASAADKAIDAPAASAAAPTAASSVTSIAPLGLDGAAQAFTDLIGRQDITVGFALLALAISVGLGGLHALAPGHGKTMMAASLVGTSGRRRDAVVLGASVTTAHTAGVVLLALALSVSSAIAAESTYPWLGLASGLLAVGVGVSLLRQARRTGHGHAHPHPHPHPHPHAHDHDTHDHDAHDHDAHGHDAHGHLGHGHHGHGHPHGALALAVPAPVVHVHEPASRDEPAPGRPATRRFIALGLAGGLVPSPSAVVVLLAGFALGRSWFALLLVVAYGLGMALTLCLTGLLLVRAGSLSQRVASGAAVPRPVATALKFLPVLAATTVVVAGLWLGVRSVLAM